MSPSDLARDSSGLRAFGFCVFSRRGSNSFGSVGCAISEISSNCCATCVDKLGRHHLLKLGPFPLVINYLKLVVSPHVNNVGYVCRHRKTLEVKRNPSRDLQTFRILNYASFHHCSHWGRLIYTGW